MTAQIFAIIAPVFLIAATGYGWARAKMPFDSAMVSALVFNIGAPCLLLSQLLSRRIDVAAMTEVVLACLAVMVLTAIAAIAILTARGLSLRAYLPPLLFPNTGNMGMPLCFFAFGDVGLSLALAYFAVTALLQFSIGIGIASGRFNVRTVAANPVLWAMAFAVALTATQTTLPTWAMDTLSTLGGFAIPLMLMSLGTSLATLSVHGLGRALAFSVFRIGGGFVAALVVVAALGLEGPARGAVLIQSAMPTAVFNYLFAVQYNNKPEDVAGIILISTVLSFATLPLLLAFVLGS
jgi:malate permease and related proteins